MNAASIEDVTEFVFDGTHGSPVRTETGIPVLSAQNVKNGALDYETDRYTSAAEYEDFKKRLPLAAGDVLLTIVGTIGRAAVVNAVAPLVFQRSVAVLRPRGDRLSSRFLYHVSQSQAFQAQLSRSSNQSSQAGVYLGKLKKLRIPLPPLPEQRRIAEILDKADALRAKRRAALAQLDTLTQSIFLDMFGDPATNPKRWPVTKLGELITVGPQNGLYKPASDYGTGAPILRIDAFYDGVVTGLATLKRVRISSEEIALYRLRPDEIVINRVNSREYLGKSALIPELGEPIVFESNMMRLGVDTHRLHPVYLIQLLQTAHVRAHILRSAKDAVNQSSINQQDVKGIPIVLPPLPRQELFAHRLRASGALANEQRLSLANLDALFGSLQQRAFAGEL